MTALEEMLQTVQLRVVVSRRRRLDDWGYDLFSPFWRLYVNDRTGAHLILQGGQFELRPGSVYLIPAGVGFRTGLARPVRHDYLHFYLTGIPLSLHHRLFPRPIAVKLDPVLRGLLRAWRSCLDEGGRPAAWTTFFWASALAHATLGRAANRVQPDAAAACARWLTQAREVRPALNAIEERLGTPPGNAELAALCSLSENHFIRIFRRSVGLTPARYGLERRLAMAAGQLAGSPRPIEAIATAHGFGDRFHFSRRFRELFGTSPAAYRRMHRQQA